MVTDMIKKIGIPEEEEDVLKLAIIGKPDAGKPSLVNRLAGEE